MIKKAILFGFIIFYTIVCFSQRHTAKYIFPDSLITLNKGIYMNIAEFLNNEPSISQKFEVINDNPDYVLYPEEKNDFYLSYYDMVGYENILNLKDVWGFYDGFGVYINYNGKPYELLYLGTISILRYEHFYNKNIVSQVFSLYALGGTETGVHKIQDMYLDLKNDMIVPRKDEFFERLISKDSEFYDMYKKDKTTKSLKSIRYLEMYNNKYPISISETGIKLN